MPGHSRLSLVGGDLLSTEVAKSNAVTPFTSGPYALPPELVDPDNEWLAFVEDRRITGGTRSYKNAHGFLKISGLLVFDDDAGFVWVDATTTGSLH